MITPDSWRKSSYSGSGDGNACVEVTLRHPCIAIRDSKNPSHGTLSVSAPVFAAFVGALREREGRPA
ncbi:DUF397 domain-containing protein [Streptomyces viridosporus]|uniref:DUF397 domain-containing protein n=1 Tax=Streptomyces viridosporus TaxID=67581 RepID=UPI000D1CEBCF|nr:DUF397 domain-containing protein [Streptomyces viridosporus]